MSKNIVPTTDNVEGLGLVDERWAHVFAELIRGLNIANDDGSNLTAVEDIRTSVSYTDSVSALVSLTEIGYLSGVTSSIQDQIDALASCLDPQGSWDADSNTPTLPGTATTGQFWIVSVAGSTDLGGITDWEINDWAIKTATGWAKIDNTDKVFSVAGRTGDVVITSSDLADFDTQVKTTKLDDFATPDDNTDLNATSTEHGLLPKLSDDEDEILDGTGAWTDKMQGTGTTAERPASPPTGYRYFDTDILYDITFDGTNYVNATGAIV